MFAKINHLAIASDQYALNGKFYEALFGFRTYSKPRPARAVVVGDGYAGLNIIPRRDGRTSGLDHFGVEVEARLNLFKKYPLGQFQLTDIEGVYIDLVEN